MKSHVHYEAAFDACLRARGVPFVPVDEGKKATFRDAKLKSFDFIVYSTQGTNWLVDIKGRRWQARRPGRKPAWENWITQEDCDGLRQWEAVFGAGFRAMLVFAYLLESAVGAPPELIYSHQEQTYIFVGIPLADYAAHARLRSPKWGTITMPTAAFAERCRPLAQWL